MTHQELLFTLIPWAE